ncbi:MAG: hypothetical protein M1122_02845, partial [Candidatus Marsarchaeota archaeon]|nr:hypothetical protein [Candidatus Marsarchaeota archaeon]
AMPNPISAGGIGPAMTAGVLAGQTAAEAVAENNISLEFVWKYNRRFNELYGNKTAAMEAFRIYLQSMNNDLLNYGMAHFITESEAVDISYGRIPELTLASTFTKILHGIANINAFRGLVYTVSKMKRLNEIYKNYPQTPGEFSNWKGLVKAEMAEVKEKFKPNPV